MSLNEPSEREYEFTETQNSTIKVLASAMKFVAIVELLLGILYGLLAVFAFMGGALGNVIVYTITSVITIILAMMLSRASGYFAAIVTTEGSDIMLLMAALDHLKSYFTTKRVLYIIAMALIAVGIVLGVFLMMGRKAEVRDYGPYGLVEVAPPTPRG
ncbi:MAG: hypothetical protein ABI867_30000 [Kofleriaceae bacterium]